jgi:DNA-binding MarR family transcriptional regulator
VSTPNEAQTTGGIVIDHPEAAATEQSEELVAAAEQAGELLAADPSEEPAAAAKQSDEPAAAVERSQRLVAVTDQSGELVAAIEQELSALFRRSRSASLRLARRVHPDMDAAGYALISQIELGAGTGVRASDVAQALGLDKSTVSRGITQLESLGLIERVGDPDDGRARLLRLTAVGADRYEAMRTQRRTEFRAILDRWNPTELSHLGLLLARLNTDLGQ